MALAQEVCWHGHAMALIRRMLLVSGLFVLLPALVSRILGAVTQGPATGTRVVNEQVSLA